MLCWDSSSLDTSVEMSPLQKSKQPHQALCSPASMVCAAGERRGQQVCMYNSWPGFNSGIS